MARTVEVPLSLLRKLARTASVFAELEDELEDYLVSHDPRFVARMRQARADHLAGRVRLLTDLKQELCIE